MARVISNRRHVLVASARAKSKVCASKAAKVERKMLDAAFAHGIEVEPAGAMAGPVTKRKSKQHEARA